MVKFECATMWCDCFVGAAGTASLAAWPSANLPNSHAHQSRSEFNTKRIMGKKPMCRGEASSTSRSMRLNSSKHAHAPLAARPLKNLPIAM